VTLQVSMQGMKPPSRRIHILGRANIIEHGQLETKSRRVLSLNPRL
jgi:hypothetical protein